ncbi:hypothetical protein ATCC90586_002861 [Pythium insidiosum]|nr:hypothetical protein ATCC90586_002861 [Pythium insidiosum]
MPSSATIANAMPWVNAAVVTVMLVASASTSSPPSHSVWPNNTPEIPIAPAPYAFLIWLVIFALTAVHAIVDCFFPFYSVYKTADNPTFLRICFAAAVNIAYAKYFVLRAREYETLISPASFAFTIWILIYALEVVLVLTDLLYPESSFYADATQPTQLRATFALTCVLNIAWLILYVKRHVVAATVMIFFLWLALLVLYVYSVNDRNSRAAFDWKLYVCSELPIAMYFAWVTMLAFVHLAIALQDSRHAFLTVATYVTHLTIVTVLALLAILYAQDAIFGLVAIWYLIAVSTKHVKLPADLHAGDMAVRACAGEAAGILGAVLVVTFLAMFLLDRATEETKMTVEVNAAAAAGCPHHHPTSAPAGAAKPSGVGASAPQEKPENCGFGAQMMTIAQHAASGGAWEVTTDRSTVRGLSSSRQTSSIPKGEYTPAHQTGTQAHWEYPSEEMYFKAMQRKGWDPDAAQMKTIVAIHNTVNEQTWHEVLKWEAMHASPSAKVPTLKRFIGKPRDYSPKARIMNVLGWSVLPFDRHDWIVEREDGTEVRYVIDFYSGQPEPGKPLSVYLDVRPALDSVDGFLDRLRWQFTDKIQPLLPFRGVFLGKDAAERSDSAAASNDGRSAVIPRKDA